MKEVVITSIKSIDGIEGVLLNSWNITFTVKQQTPIKYEMQGVLEWKGDPILDEIQPFLEKLTDEVKIKRIRTRK